MECAIFYGPFFHLLHKDAIQIGAQPSVRTTQSEIFVVMHWRIGGGGAREKMGSGKGENEATTGRLRTPPFSKGGNKNPQT